MIPCSAYLRSSSTPLRKNKKLKMVNKQISCEFLKVSKQSYSDESKATVGWHPTRVRPFPALQPRWYPQNHQIGEVWQWEMPKGRFFLIKFVIYTKRRTSVCVYIYMCVVSTIIIYHMSFIYIIISYNIEYRISYIIYTIIHYHICP